MQNNNGLGLSSDFVIQNLDSIHEEDCKPVSVSTLTSEDSFFSNSVSEYNQDDLEIEPVSNEKAIEEIEYNYQIIIQDLQNKLLQSQNNYDNIQQPLTKSDNNDVNYLLKVFELTLKNLENGRHERAMNDIVATLEEFNK